MKDIIKKNKVLLILLSIILLSSVWLITKGMPYAHDIGFHYARLVGLSTTIKNGDFLALIHDAFYGYGYANGIFYGNFYFYIPALINILGISSMSSFKIFYLLINIATTLITYFCAKSIIKDKKTAIITTILYMFSGYRIIDIFVRGAMGEMLAFMIIPIIILGLYEIVYRDYKKWYLFTIGFVLLLIAHLITTALIAIFSLIFIIINYKKLLEDKNRIKYLIISGVVGILLGAFFLLPILEQKLYGNISIFENGSYFQPKDKIVKFIDFLVPRDFFNTHLGFSLILLLPLRIFIRKLKNVDKDLLKFADILTILGIIAWISTTSIFPWKLLNNYVEFIQFPWRLLIVATTFLCFANCIYIKTLIDNKEKNLLKYSYIVILGCSIIMISLYSVQYGIRKVQYHTMTPNEIGGGEYLPATTKEFDIVDAHCISNNSSIDIEYKSKGTRATIKYTNNTSDDTFIEIPLFYYLGYGADGANIESGDNGLIRLTNLKESGTIKVSYKMTTLQKASHIISLITLIGLTGYIIIERKK